MKRLFLVIYLMGYMQTSVFAQSLDAPSDEFAKLKNDMVEACNKEGGSKEIKSLAKQIDTFLSHINIGMSEGDTHNEIPFLSCQYDHTPMTMPAILIQGTTADTIQFQDGRWYISKELSPDMDIAVFCYDNQNTINNKKVKRTMDAMNKKHTYHLGDELVGKKGNLFFVKEENLYYAAIESKKIPTFAILSNNEVINYATCLKAILKASGIEVTYDEIIGKYLNTTIDEQFVPAKDRNSMLAGRKVVTTFIPQHSINASTLVDELIRDRFTIAIDKNGSIGILTAIALIGETEYQPMHVRLRVPSLVTGETRVQMSWRDFSNNIVTLVKVDIY